MHININSIGIQSKQKLTHQCAQNFRSHYMNLVKVETCLQGEAVKPNVKISLIKRQRPAGRIWCILLLSESCFFFWEELKYMSSRGLFQLTNEASGAGPTPSQLNIPSSWSPLAEIKTTLVCWEQIYMHMQKSWTCVRKKWRGKEIYSGGNAAAMSHKVKRIRIATF